MSNHRFYVHQPVRFQCSGCGDCCSGDPDTHYIELLTGEAERIREYLQLSRSVFQHDHIVNNADIGKSIRIKEDGRCSLLGADNRCQVYEVRPLQCRSYPFWPEIMQTPDTWMAEASYCEGIHQGDAIAPEHIDSQLALYQEHVN